MTKKKRKFTGKLAKPIRINTQSMASKSLLASDEEIQNQLQRDKQELVREALSATVQQLEKIVLLFEHYGIAQHDNDRWCWLAINLARDYVPEFQIESKKRRGRGKTWDDAVYAFLYFTIHKKMHQSKHSTRTLNISDVCKSLVKNHEPWKSMNVKAKTLENNYALASESPQVSVFKTLFDLLPNGATEKEKGELLDQIIEMCRVQTHF